VTTTKTKTKKKKKKTRRIVSGTMTTMMMMKAMGAVGEELVVGWCSSPKEHLKTQDRRE
jgi:hypothetical protein